MPSDLTNAVEVGVIGYSIAALRADGSVAEWGNNAHDPGVSNLVYFSSGWSHAIGQRPDGTITGWGDDAAGEISGFPPGLTNVAMFVAGAYFTLAVLPDGSLIGRGGNFGNGLSIPPGATNVVSVATVAHESLLLRADGTVLEWNYFLGTNAHPELSNVVAVASDDYDGAALLFDGTVVAWPDPAPPGLTNITAIAGGGGAFLALKSDGTVTGWGCDCGGALTFPASLSNVTAIAIGGADGYTHSAFLIGLPPSPAPILSVQSASASSGLVRLRLDGLPRRHYVLEEATALSSGPHWTFSQNIVLASPTKTFELPMIGSQHLYRVRLLP